MKEIHSILIRSLPALEGASLRELANTIGMNVGQLSRILSGERGLTIQTAIVIIESLNLGENDAEDLLRIAVFSSLEIRIEKLDQQIRQATLVPAPVGQRVMSTLIKIQIAIERIKSGVTDGYLAAEPGIHRDPRPTDEA